MGFRVLSLMVAAFLLTAACTAGRSDAEQEFCDEVIPLVDGRTPTTWEMEDILDAASSLPSGGDRSDVLESADALSRALQPWWAPGPYSTWDLIEDVAEICSIEGLEWIIASPGSRSGS